MQRKKNITILDVAKQAGVSKMTVSRVLNNELVVKPSTRERIYSAMEELNFRPNGLARSLAGGQSIYVGMLYTNPSYFYLSELLFGALQACRERGHHVLVDEAYTMADLANPNYITKRFFETGVHAVMLAPPLSEIDEVVSNIERSGIDLVCIGVEDQGRRLCVSMDDKAASRELTQHLIDLGHRDIAIIHGPPDHKRASKERLEGFKSAMSKNGLAINEKHVAAGDFTMLSGMAAARKILDQQDRPTAIFACNDDMAIGAIHAVYQFGLRIPDDISVVGFDDIAMATSIWPPLTTVRQPIRQMAIAAIDLLEKQRNGAEQKSRNVVLDYEIVVRQSSAPPPR